MPLSLPDRASFEYLKRLAKERLSLLRLRHPDARLADAQMAIAREYGFATWRALKSEIDRRRAPNVAEFTQACRTGDVDALRRLLAVDANLAREPLAGGATGLHLAVRHPPAVRLLLEHGADPNARDTGDNASPLHVAAADGVIESVAALLDAGADVHGAGDVHKGGVIGWASRRGNEAVVALLLERGARHHIFSAMAFGDRDLVEAVVEEHPESLAARRSRFESGHTPLHAAFAPPDGLGPIAGAPDYAMLELLVRLGADLEATDDKGRTALALAVLRGDGEAMRILRAAGAKEPEPARSIADVDLAALQASVRQSYPMLSVPDMRATVGWYESIGFTARDRYEESGELLFVRLTFGACEFALSSGGGARSRDVSLWLFTDRVRELYEAFKQRVLHATAPDAAGGSPEVRFEEDLYAPFYGGQQFSIRDINGLSLVFWQPDWLQPAASSKDA